MLTRRSPLARSAPLRRTRLRFNGKSSTARRARAHARCFGAPRPGDGDTRDDAIRRMPCLAAGRADHRCQTPVQAAHAVARAGAKGDRFKLVPLCADAHRAAGELPSLWYRSDPKRYALTQRGQWEAEHDYEPGGLLAAAERIALQLTEEGYP
jgi:hypothetical protein